MINSKHKFQHRNESFICRGKQKIDHVKFEGNLRTFGIILLIFFKKIKEREEEDGKSSVFSSPKPHACEKYASAEVIKRDKLLFIFIVIFLMISYASSC